MHANYWFSADHHLGHTNILKYANRPFSTVEEMNNKIIENHNSLVGKADVVVVCGDFSFYNKEKTYKDFINKMNGTLVFLKGSHDRWLNKKRAEIWEKKLGNNYICACHYALATWPRSHYNAFMLYGHSHGTFQAQGKSIDVGVDCHNFYPISLEQVIEIMKNRPDNLNLIKKSFGN